MTWDFAEGNPFGKSSSELLKCVAVITASVELLPPDQEEKLDLGTQAVINVLIQ